MKTERLYTVAEAAKILDIGYSTVTKYLRELGIERRGRDYFLTDEQVGQVRANLVRGGYSRGKR